MFSWLKRRKRSVNVEGTWPVFDMALFEETDAVLFGALAKHWSERGPYEAAPMDAVNKIAQIEQRYSVNIPEDFRAYLQIAAPSVGYMDDIGTLWWAIDELKNVPDECQDVNLGPMHPEIEGEKETYLIFSDFLVWCYAWAICCSEGKNRGRIALIGGSEFFVADSFREFLALELADSSEIHVGRQKK